MWDQSVADWACTVEEHMDATYSAVACPKCHPEYRTAQIPDDEYPAEYDHPLGPARAVLGGLAIAAGFWVLVWAVWFLLG